VGYQLGGGLRRWRPTSSTLSLTTTIPSGRLRRMSLSRIGARLVLASAVATGALAASSMVAGQAKPSATALEVAAYRAIGARHPDVAVRNGDHLAERLIGPAERAILAAGGAEAVVKALDMNTDAAWAGLGNRSVFARGVHIRTRHIDDVLSDSLAAGVEQIVLLGAGLDSRAYRFDALRRMRVFELDLPQTQEYKKGRIREIFGALPGHVTYVPIDFTSQDLGDVLDGAGYDAKKKALFIWEGVSMYIPETAVDATLRAVTRKGVSGSRIVFDYFLRSALDSSTSALRDVSKMVAKVGEPFVFGVAGEDAKAFVAARGLRVLSDFGSAELGKRFLPAGIAMPSPSANRICTAVVP
jgi:methyltransferase (TIGR00027 family)